MIKLVEDKGRSFEASESASLTIPYTATGSDDWSAIETYAVTNIPKNYGGRKLERVRGKEVSDKCWEITAEYALPEGSEESDEVGGSPLPLPRDTVIDVDIMAEKVTMTHSLQTVSSKHIEPGQTAPDFKNALNVDEKGKPKGLEVGTGNSASTTFTLRRRFATSAITNEFLYAIEGAAGKTNSNPFRGRAAGEVLFLGCRGSINLTEPEAELSYQFAVSKNRTDLTVGPFTNITKKGWEYAWILSKKSSTDAKIQPIAIYVEKVMETDAFDQIGL